MSTIFMAFADTDGDVQLANAGFTDNGSPIHFELETQQIDFGNRAHIKKIADMVVVFAQDAADTSFAALPEGDDEVDIPVGLDERVNIGEEIDIEGKYIIFRWSGVAETVSPIFEGFEIPKITDIGMSHG